MDVYGLFSGGVPQTETPAFSPAAGTYTSAQSVTLSDATSGAAIYYTTDGSTPTISSTPYTGPISVTQTTTINAMATASGLSNSPVATATYTIQAINFVHVQGNSAVSGATGANTISLTMLNPVTAGNLMVCGLSGADPTNTTLVSLKDQAGNLYAVSPNSPTAYLSGAGMGWGLYNLTPPAGNTTLLATLGAGSVYAGQYILHCDEFNPVGGTPAFDLDAVNSNAGPSPVMNLPSITPTASSSLLYALGNPRWNITGCGAPWVCGGSGIQSSTGYGLGGTASEYLISATGATPISFTQNDSGTWSAVAMSFKIGANTTQTATPTFSPAGGTYSSAQSVTLSDTTSGAAIYYTTDGSTPTTNSTRYTAPISVTQTTTINAIAAASGLSNSAVGTATYTINTAQTATPTFSPAGGTYSSAQSVTLSDTTSGAAIYYTTDGSTPTTNSTRYTAPISVTQTTTINAIAAASGLTNSSVATATYNIQVAPPTNFTHVQGNSALSGAAGTRTVSLTMLNPVTAGNLMVCGLSGVDPTNTTLVSLKDQAGNLYAVSPKSPTAYLSGAGLGWGLYNLTPPAGNTTLVGTLGSASVFAGQYILHCDEFNPVGGTPAFDLDAINSNAGPSTLMNLPSITPTASSSLLYALGNPRWNITGCGAPWVCGGSGIQSSTGFGVGGTATEYITNATGATPINFTQNNSGTWSAVAMSFKIGANATQTATPTFSPAGGTYTSAQSVTLSDTTSGAAIYYTTDGSTPTTNSTRYTAPISVTQTTTINAIAAASGLTNSSVATATYTINTAQTATPTFSPAGGTYSSAQSVTLSDTTSGAAIYYTTDGSTPTTNSTRYTAPISVTQTTTINAIAAASGLSNSAVGHSHVHDKHGTDRDANFQPRCRHLYKRAVRHPE